MPALLALGLCVQTSAVAGQVHSPSQSAYGDTDAVYDSESLSSLSEHMDDGEAELEEAPPPEPSAGNRSLAALPSGGGPVPSQAGSLPAGAGTQLGMGESFTAQLSTGASSYSVPLAVPLARGGVQPRLDLSYGSGAGNGVAGLGWSFGGAAISRQTDRGLPTYQDEQAWYAGQDRFVFGTSELVPICRVINGACSNALPNEVMPAWANGWQYFRTHIEAGLLRFFWSPDHRTWRVHAKDGTNMEFGVPLDGTGYQGALERNPANATQVFRWYLVRQYDSAGAVNTVAPAPVNKIVYRYMEDGGLLYLTDIFDTTPHTNATTNDLSTFAHHTRLVYEARPDVIASYRRGWLTELSLRIARVDVTSKPFTGSISSARSLLRRYHFSYDSSLHSSVLTGLQLEGRCPGDVNEDATQRLPLASCPRLPKLTFEYQRVDGSSSIPTDSQGYQFEPFNSNLVAHSYSPPHSLDEARSELLDVNADALPDLLVTAPGLFHGHHGLFLNGLQTGDPGFQRVREMPVRAVGTVVDADVLSFSSPTISILDLDADGIANIVHTPTSRSYEIFAPHRTPDGNYEWAGRIVDALDGQDAKIDFTRNATNVRVLDVNGDGLVDIVYSSPTELQTFFSLGRHPAGDGQFGHAIPTNETPSNISNDPVIHCTPWSSTPVRFSDPDTSLADMNADGFADIVRIRDGHILYWPGRGTGYWGTDELDSCVGAGFAVDQHVEMLNAPRYGTAGAGGITISDVNGDGLADVIEVTATSVEIYLNDNGQSFTDVVTIDDTPFTPNHSSSVRITDINGSGSADVLWGTAHSYRYIDLTGGVTPYLLTKVTNGLGQSTDLTYASSTELMLDAARDGEPWSSTSPAPFPVLTRSTVRDNLQVLGKPGGTYVTKYKYRDPVYDGRQREFRGFRRVVVSKIGDDNSPTGYQAHEFLVGESPPLSESAESNWQLSDDNWRDAIKGLTAVVETYDTAGIYLSTEHSGYTLELLYTGLDERRVVAAQPTRKTAFLYDTADFIISPNVSHPVTDVVYGFDDHVNETRELQVRAATGAARLESETRYDLFGNTTHYFERGCQAGCPNGPDETVVARSQFALPPGDQSGWLWRETQAWAENSLGHRRYETRKTYDTSGRLYQSFSTVSGNVPLERPAGGAPPPSDQSLGVTAPVEVLKGTSTYDAYGNIVSSVSAGDRCQTAALDNLYKQLLTSATLHAGPRNGAAGCGQRLLTDTFSYDRGLAEVTDAVDARGQPTRVAFDEFGRLRSVTGVNPASPGNLAPHPSMIIEYHLPTDANASPYSRKIIKTQRGASVLSNAYTESHSWIDGLGRTFLALTEADAPIGLGAVPGVPDWSVNGPVEYDTKGAPARSFDATHYRGAAVDALSIPYATLISSAHGAQEYDAFGRPTWSYDSGEVLPRGRIMYQALSVHAYDAEDLRPGGAHHGTHASSVSDGHGRLVQSIRRAKSNNGTGPVEELATLRRYLFTGELREIIERRSGVSDVSRWFRYNTVGQLVLNVEPNTSAFVSNPDSNPVGLAAIRYAYNNAGDIVGFTDARGCGANFIYDAAGRLIVEDQSPCSAAHATYTAPNLDYNSSGFGDGSEVFYRYDVPDPSGAIVDDAGATVAINASLLPGEVASISTLGTKKVFSYDARGDLIGTATRVQRPGTPAATLSTRYAPRWYISRSEYDAASRPTSLSTGMTLPGLQGSDGTSTIRYTYGLSGLTSIGSSYGTLVASVDRRPDGLVEGFTLGDATGTRRAFTYEEGTLAKSLIGIQTYRGNIPLWSVGGGNYTPPTGTEDPTLQELLEDTSFTYDRVGNILAAVDHRLPEEWPTTHAPASKYFVYDDLYRLVSSGYLYTEEGEPENVYTKSSAWQSPFAAEAADSSRPQPVPHVSFSTRVGSLSQQYDWLGNITRSTDNQSAFWDRSSGDRVHNASGAVGPHRVVSASNRALAPTSPQKGDLSVGYDVAGNVTSLVVRRDGTCLPAGKSCWQRFVYDWNPAGQLARARRWDLAAAPSTERVANDGLNEPLPSRAADADLNYHYDGANRILKTATDAVGVSRHTVYVSSAYEIRATTWSGADYALNDTVATLRLPAGPVTARVVSLPGDLPSTSGLNRHVFLELTDYLGSNTILVDHDTGELVEHATYLPFGATESDYRPDRWDQYREAYRFTGKEDDIEVGLSYFGARYYSPHLSTWLSPDPVAIYDAEGDSNPYAYVRGRPTAAVDPDGRDAWAVIDAIAAVTNVASALFYVQSIATQMIANDSTDFNRIEWGLSGVAGSIIVGHVASAATAGTGAGIGASSVPGAVGSVSGFVGAGAGYATNAAITGGEGASWSGFFLSLTIGALGGAAGDMVGWGAGKIFDSPAVASIVGNAAGTAATAGLSVATNQPFNGRLFAVSLGTSVAQSAAISAASASSWAQMAATYDAYVQQKSAPQATSMPNPSLLAIPPAAAVAACLASVACQRLMMIAAGAGSTAAQHMIRQMVVAMGKTDPQRAAMLMNSLTQPIVMTAQRSAPLLQRVFTSYVYRSIDPQTGQTIYVGITNNLARRAVEHLSAKGIQIERVMTTVTRYEARCVEQALIEIHGLSQHGGSLINQINSIARTNPAYAKMVQAGYQLLQQAGYQ